MTAQAVDDLLDFLDALEELEALADADPLAWMDWLPGQRAWLSDAGPNPKLYRAGVRSGKSTAGMGEVIFRARGAHPFLDVPPAPVRLALITSDKQAQGVQIMRLFWDLVRKDELVPDVEFNPKTGFRGHVPVVQFKNGSEVTWYSNNAGPRALQGAEFDYVGIDEPPDEDVFDEAQARVRNTGGMVGLTLTPLHKPVPWLRERCENGKVTDHHYPLTVDNQRGVITGELRRTKAGVVWDQAFLDGVREREGIGPAGPIKLDGEWEMRTDGQFFDCFDADKHVSAVLPSGALNWYLGIDYAAADREHGMCAVLSGVQVDHIQTPNGRETVHRVWTLDEVVMPGTASMESFAVEILAMLRDRGFKWRELDAVYGDNPVKSRYHQVGNPELTRWLSRRLGRDQNRLRPRLFSAKEGGGASGRQRRTKDVRSTWMWEQLSRGFVRIHPRCTTLLQALQEYDYSDRHPLKDVTDAWMYALKEQWGNPRRRTYTALDVA